MDQTLIDRIVASVLEQLQPATPRAVMERAGKSATIALQQAVITADVLSAAVQPGQAVQIGTKSLLTPSAKDWLKQHRIDWQRGTASVGLQNPSSSAVQGRLLLSTVTPTIRGAADSIFRSLSNWSRQIGGNAKEAVETTSRMIAAAECDRIVITSRDADLVACLANRNSAVRAAVAIGADHIRRLEASLSPNVIVIDPTERSFVELRNLFRACANLGKPAAKVI